MALDRIEEAMSLLGAAISQSLPSDDQIIMEHVRDAHKLLQQEYRERQDALRADANTSWIERFLRL